MQSAFFYKLFFALGLALTPVCLCAQQADDAGNATDTASTQSSAPIEEITVVGEKTLLAMRHQIELEEENLYGMFNDLNSSDELDIRCRTMTKRLSHLTERICEPVFLTNYRIERNRNALTEIRQAWSDEGIDPVILLNGLDLMESEYDLRKDSDHKFEELSEEMLRIALENPEYFATLQRISRLKEEFEAARKLEFGK